MVPGMKKEGGRRERHFWKASPLNCFFFCCRRTGAILFLMGQIWTFLFDFQIDPYYDFFCLQTNNFV